MGANRSGQRRKQRMKRSLRNLKTQAAHEPQKRGSKSKRA